MENLARSKEELANTWQSYEATMERFKPVSQGFYDFSDEMERQSEAVKSVGLDGTEGAYRFYLENLVPAFTRDFAKYTLDYMKGIREAIREMSEAAGDETEKDMLNLIDSIIDELSEHVRSRN